MSDAGTGPIRIPNMKQFVDAIRKATEDKTGENAVKRANIETGNLVIRMARRYAVTQMERRAADTLTVSKAMAAVRVVGGDQDTPYFGGANFGAHKNRLRLIKARAVRDYGKGVTAQRRARATMVRDEEDWRKVVKRVERQYVDSRGRTISRRQGGQQVLIARTKSGAIRKVRGWNQFRPWVKGRDYFLFEAVRKHYDEIVEFYIAALGDAWREVFPDLQ